MSFSDPVFNEGQKMVFTPYKGDALVISGSALTEAMDSEYGKSFLFAPNEDCADFKTLKHLNTFFNKKFKKWNHRSIFKNPESFAFYVKVKKYTGILLEKHAEGDITLQVGYYFDVEKQFYGLYFTLIKIE